MKDIEIPRSPRGPHPSPETLLAALRQPEDAAGREVLDHAVLCADCSLELVHLEAFLGSGREADPAIGDAWKRFRAARPARRRRAFPAWALAAAAAAIAAIAVPLLVRRPAADVERGESAAATLLAPRGSLAAPPSRFSFRLPPGKKARVMIFDADRTFEWTSPPSDGVVPLPDAERRRLRSGRDYFWTLVGTEGSAPVARFRITPR